MFETFEMAPPDSILGLTEAFKKDTNPDKINLSVGVYKNASGATPILRCVKEAERRLLQQEQTKGYLGIDGLPDFCRLARELLFTPDCELLTSGRAVSLQTPGGTGALRVAADFLKQMVPGASIWVSKPTWANHPNVFEAADRQVGSYRYIDASGTTLDFDGMLQSLNQIPAGDVVLLHGCCHNPTGIDPTPGQWQQIADVVQQRKLLPLIDFAYQGFGQGIDEDAFGLRTVVWPGTEAMVCSSFSKNFGLYSERVGALTLIAGSADAAQAALSHAKVSVRTNYSNPPRHGGAIVATVLANPELRAMWEEEVAEMRARIHAMRTLFVETMKQKAPQRDFSFIASQCGMFSFSGLTPVQVDELKSKHAVYIVTSGGRMNVAGMTERNMDRLCAAIASVL